MTTSINTISKETRQQISNFISFTMPKASDKDCAKAIRDMIHNFQEYNLAFLPPDKELTKGAKGGKSVAHNAPEDSYARVTSEGVQCPMLLKPISTSALGFLGYVLVPDSNRISDHKAIESFCLAYESKLVAKHDDYIRVSVELTARQLGEDRRNNLAQGLKRKAEKEQSLETKITAFTSLPAETWALTKSAVAAIDSDLVELIEARRLELADNKAQADKTLEATA